MKLLSLNEKNFTALKQKNDIDKIINFFMDNYWSKIWDLRGAHEKSLNEMKELKRFQGSTSDTIVRRRLVEDQDIILELTGKIQELQNEINCMNDSRDFQDAESVHSGHSHVTSRSVSFPPHPITEGMLSRSLGVPSRKDGPPSIWDTHGMSGNVFTNPAASSSAPYPQELNPWSSHMSEPIHSSPLVMSESQTPVQDQRWPISDPHFDKFSTPATFAWWKIRFKTQVCSCSQFSYGSNAVDQRSADGWFSVWFKMLVICKRNANARFWSTRCEDCFSTEQNHPQFSLQKKPRSKTVSFAASRLLTWFMNTFGSLVPTILSRIMPTCSLLVFVMMIFRNSIVYDENPTWWHLGKIVQIKNTRVWET